MIGIDKLTLEEKIQLIHGVAFFKNGGVGRLSIPQLVMSDGPMGVRHEIKDTVWEPACETDDYVTYFPSNIALASTFAPGLAKEMGRCLGAEARGRGKDIILAPGINIIRTPLCGRNFEYLSEDPYLIRKMAVPLIQGIQENDVAACVKHFAVNNQETRRMDVNVEVDERTMREIYLPGFEACVKEAGVYAIMSAYNKLRNEYCSHSRFLLNEILKMEWEYDGIVISDWAAVHDTKKAVSCGLDLEMSTEANFDEYYLASPLLRLIKEGVIPESLIDDKVSRILRTLEKIKKGSPKRCKGSYNHPQHFKCVKKVAEESVILLKNDGILPLEEGKTGTIGVIGENADKLHASGGGSAEIKALYEISPLLGIRMLLGGNTQVLYEKGYSSDAADSQKDREEFIRRAEELAEKVDTLIFIGGQNHEQDSEGMDRADMKLPYGQEHLIDRLLAVRPDMTVVLTGGSPVEMGAFAERAKSIIQMFYAGSESGMALAEVLFGLVNPSGRLPVTFPKKLEDSPAHALKTYPGDDTVTYKEGIFVGYRYFDAKGIEPQFCFGHGLSYTGFEYKNLKISYAKDGKPEVKVAVQNIGAQRGKEVVQLYLGFFETEEKLPELPPLQLKSFSKIDLEPMEEREITITLDSRDMCYYDVTEGQWKKINGGVQVFVGASSRDIRLSGML